VVGVRCQMFLQGMAGQGVRKTILLGVLCCQACQGAGVPGLSPIDTAMSLPLSSWDYFLSLHAGWCKPSLLDVTLQLAHHFLLARAFCVNADVVGKDIR